MFKFAVVSKQQETLSTGDVDELVGSPHSTSMPADRMPPVLVAHRSTIVNPAENGTCCAFYWNFFNIFVQAFDSPKPVDTNVFNGHSRQARSAVYKSRRIKRATVTRIDSLISPASLQQTIAIIGNLVRLFFVYL
jgi:hypothetical protein